MLGCSQSECRKLSENTQEEKSATNRSVGLVDENGVGIGGVGDICRHRARVDGTLGHHVSRSGQIAPRQNEPQIGVIRVGDVDADDPGWDRRVCGAAGWADGRLRLPAQATVEYCSDAGNAPGPPA